jgi:TonB family protein
MIRETRGVIFMWFATVVLILAAVSVANAQNPEAQKIFQHFRENILTTSHEDCVRDMTRAIKLDTRNADYVYYRGWCYMLAKDGAKALADLNATLDLDPQYIKALYDRSYVLSWADKQQALPDLKRIIDIAPNEINAYALMAAYYIGLGRYDDAYAMGARMVELVPSAGTGYRYQADALSRQGKYTDAVKLYGEAIRRAEWDAEAYRGRAAAYRSLGDNAAASVDEQTAKTLNQTTGGGMGVGTGRGDGKGPLTNPVSTAPADNSNYQSMQITRSPRPEYTTQARNDKIQGSVMLKVTFKADGTIGPITVISALPDGLTDKAIEAAKAIVFKPATRNGVAVTSVKTISVSFTLY